MLLVAYGLGVGPCSRNEEVQRLCPCISGTLSHDVEELSVGLGMEFVEYHTMDVESVLRVRLRRQHLVEAVRGEIDDPLC